MPNDDDFGNQENLEDRVRAEQIGAFFDIDETLVRGASVFWVAKEMFIRQLIGLKDIQYAARESLRFVLFGENKKQIGQLTDRAANLVAGQSVSEFVDMGEQIFTRYFVPNVYLATYQRLQKHVAEGHQVWLISATPWIIAEVFATHIGAKGGMGTKPKLQGDLVVGELDGGILHGPAKAEAVKEISAREGLSLADSWAYSDSANDLPLLSSVGHPVAVNPDKELEYQARIRGWEILQAREPKDRIKRGVIKFTLGATMGGLTFYLGRKIWTLTIKR